MGRVLAVIIEEIVPGMRFSVNVADGSVLMEVQKVRCGDVWDVEPAEDDVPSHYYQPYGEHMVFTTAKLRAKIAMYRRYAPEPEWGVA